MVDILGMMKKAEELKARMSEMQDKLGDLLVEGKSGGGLVTVTLTGKYELRGLKIDPSLMKAGEEGILEDLIVAAHADAKGKAEIEAAQQMQELTAGLPLPPGMKLPF
ncbi:MAG TPA: YbaB/EbfC family nucleoid-associated protein [Devosiaceae bacterium]|jgi:DNA-binding YbaB/EbfC family protein|nr:YbaB/EbfC family nucleoid-associated protein [Devosiaceae bacterium]